ncbi:BBF_HP2_G0024530.mRNA.1.CDS.1 [Saccharomyces cerevisiae]|nr:BBF_HP2_G0024530.mRNA.1.CDS.1 [Saccharomyces cerevisiae]CAI6565895.1 BBF_HP2_G0024530.mRNA.1.CDS.1 [Saccharomyces cerevisiae]CAI6568932.1 BBF_HP1_G0024790.mRNA.1.CDS.1 [Saccharomyces cerevisiae]
MSLTEQIEQFASRFRDDDATLQSRYSTLSELYDIMELLNSPEDYHFFLQAVIPLLLNQLKEVPISYDAHSPEQKLRNSMLDIFNRCLMNQTFQPYAMEVLEFLLSVLPKENEENGILCMKVLTTLFKSFKSILQDKLDSFIRIIIQIYKNTPNLINQTFYEAGKAEQGDLDSPKEPQADELLDEFSKNDEEKDFPSKQSSTEPRFENSTSSNGLRSSMFSFKILSECPITMVTLYSSYKQLTSTSLPEFTPLIMNLLNIQIKQQQEAREQAESRGEHFTSISTEIINRPAYCDFILAQIKATSFLAYVFIRGYAPEFLQDYVNFVPDLIIRLLQDCPSELSSARKELLHATRHILSTNYKKLFLPKLDYLFDERILIGNGFTMHETLRPLAYSTVADFIHNIRSELQLSEIEKTIKIYTGYLLDESLALTVQIMSAKLLLNLVERILKLGKENPQEAPRAKKLLMIIIDSYMNRFKTLNRQYDTIMKYYGRYETHKKEKAEKVKNSIQDNDKESEEFMRKVLEPSDDDHLMPQPKKEDINDSPDVEMTESDKVVKNDVEMFDIKNYAPILLLPTPTNDPIKDAFYLYRTLMSFLKTIIHDLKVFNPPPNEYTVANPKLWASVSRVFSYEEVIVFKDLFHECIIGLQFFKDHNEKLSPETTKKHFDISMPSLPVSATKDARELMDYLAFMFMQMDNATFNEIIEQELPFVYERMLEDSGLLHVAQSFLTSEITSPNFAGILLRFLKGKLKDLGNVDFNTSNVLIRLFKLSFMSVNLFPNINEVVLLPHLNDLILNSLKYSTTAEEPLVYFYLIRTLFRSIGGGRFENLYRSIKPILQVLLQSLNQMILTARLPHERELYVELCITVPVRLSVLAPYLPFLMKPLVFALQQYPDLVSQGLRTLELCIDNLTAEYFDPIIEPVIDDVSKALFNLLQPQPFNHAISHNVVRILGKLGGRNRQFLKPPTDLTEKTELDIDAIADFKINGMPEDVPLSVTPGIQSALNILQSYKSDIHYRKSAYKYLTCVLLLMTKSSAEFPTNYTELLKTAVNSIKLERIEIEKNFDLEPTVNKRDYSNQENLFLRLLESVFYATSIKELKDDAMDLLNNLLDHFCLLQVNTTLLNKRNYNGTFNIDLKNPNFMLDSSLILDAIPFALSYYIPEVREVGVLVYKRIYEKSCLIYGEELALSHSFIPELAKQFIHLCYDETYYNKRGGVLGIKVLIDNVKSSSVFLKKYQYNLANGLLFVLKDTQSEAPSAITDSAEKLLIDLLSITFADVKEEDLGNKVLENTLTDIVCELSNANPKVRNACQKSLHTISNLTGIPIVKLMDHSKQFLLSPIFAKPLRALPFTMQIGNVDAITFCLSLPNTFLTFNEELFRLLQESIVLADAEDESLSTNIQKTTEYSTSEQLVQLRIACIKLLAIALKNEEFATAQQGNIRIRILAVFFKTMLKTSPEIINTTYEALKGSLAENSKLPKELLQNGLKPLLMNLSDHQKLTVPGLDALSKLLELLIAYFKVEIGRKLLDHLTAWCRVEVLDTLFGQDLAEQMPTKIIVSIINIFHLLPPQADMFLNDLLLKVMLLERKLRLQLDSPFRTPLARYLNRFHNPVTEYFKKNMTLRQLVLFMCNIVQRPEAKELAEDFEKELDNFYDFYISNIPKNQVRVVSFFTNMVDLFNTMVITNGDEWLKKKGNMILKLKDMLNLTLKTIKENSFYIDHLQLNQSIAKFQALYLRFTELSERDQNPLLLDFIDFSFSNGIKASYSLKKFIFHNIIASSNKEKQNNFINDATLFVLSDKCLDARIFVLKNVINSTLIYEVATSGSLKSYLVEDKKPKWLELLHNKIWKNSNAILAYDVLDHHDLFRFELLQLSAIFIKADPEIIAEIKKDIIKFCWNFIKLEDTLIKQSAYLVTSYFISKFDFPIKVVTQVFVALLRSSHVEARYLVKQSLDVLTPVLHERMNAAGTPDTWINWVKRVMVENSSSQNNILYQFLISHPDLFFNSRDLFISNIIHHMNKITFMSNSNSDSHTLAIDLASLILYWENKTLEITNVNNTKTDSDGDVVMSDSKSDINPVEADTTAIIVDANNNSPISLHLREACTAFLIRYVCASNHRAIETELGLRAINILSELISDKHWTNVNVKLVYFEKFLIFQDLDSENILYYCMNALDVLYVFFKNKTKEWIMENLPTIQNLLEKCIKSDHHDVQEALQKVLQVIMKAIKAQGVSVIIEEESPGKTFIQMLTSVITQDLQETSSVTAGVTLAWVLFMNFPDNIVPLLTPLMKTFSKLCKDHLSISQPKDAMALEEARITTKLLEKVLYILSLKVSLLGDSRRPFLSTVALLIDHSMDQNFLRKIVNMSRSWIFNTEIFPTVKEKAAILTKMLAFEIRGEPSLSKLFYEIVLKLFDQEHFNNTEITVRMEQPFLVGTRVEDIGIRKRFMTILDNSLERDIKERLYYVIRDQNWEFIADYPWLNQALQLLYGSFNREKELSLKNIYCLSPPSILQEYLPENAEMVTEVNDLELSNFVKGHIASMQGLCRIISSDFIDSLIEIFYQDPKAIHRAWVTLFPQVYKSIPKNEKYGFVRSIITLLSKPYHTRQISSRTNVINMLLDSISKIESLELPPHLVKYLAISYNAWYQSINILESIQSNTSIDNTKIIEANEDALLELYVNLQEEDMFYGLWRRRAKYTETNIGLSYEQIGLWDKAQQLYEVAQVKARSGALPYSQSEYALWEDNWIQCAEKLQHWDVLTELAKHEGFTDLLLECGWRVADWNSDRDALEQSVKSVMDVPTPRRQMFKTFLALQNFAESRKGDQEVRKLCDEGIQLSLIKWVSLPIRYTPAHKWLLHGFQQYMEFLEAAQIYANLHTTTVQNLDSKAQEIKRILQAWRDRLPNTWDDVNMWNDLVTWRQHAFQVINNAYLPLIPALQQSNSNSNINTHAYRGYHEIAWVINRFAHVARKHNMPDVCISQLARIYTLPNIEIQEAFLKLREQAKCHYQNMNELTTGLDVISNTNLVYFGTVQKAEFFTLKGMFLSKLRAYEEANQAFATAVQIDLNLAKAWAQWGFFNDRRLSEEPNNISFASNAISCYLQAAGLYKNSKIRELLCRILWLISIDDASGMLTNAFDSFRGEIPVWYWITFIPQLLTSLSHKEANMVRHILIRIAKSYPQALHFQLRTTKEDFAVIQRQTMAVMGDKPDTNDRNGRRQPWEYLQELNNILKTAYPLLALSLESLVAQINDRFKSTTDEDLFRLINVLLIDGTLNYNRLPFPRKNPKLPENTEKNLVKFSTTLLAPYIRPKFNADFIDNKPDYETYIKRLRYWRRRLENKLDRASKKENLEVLCPHLSNFHHQKFEDIEIPGQYLLNKDNNVHFIKIARFLPTVDFVRGTHSSYRRLMIRGHDGSVHSFAVQYPAVRHSRREERMFQLYRLFNKSLSKNVETRRRSIQFNLPIAIPLSPQVRIMNDSVSFTTLHEIHNEFCKKKGFDPDDIQDFMADKLNAAHDDALPAPDMTILKVEIFNSIQTMFVPSNVLKDHFTSLFTQFEDFWLFRKQFALQYSSFVFMSYMMMINNRTPHKIHVDKTSGNVFTLEMLPSRFPYERVKPLLKNHDLSLPPDSPIFHNNEPVPFRLTPNIQSLIGDSALEGIFAVNLFTISRALIEPDNELNTYLALFIRDEIISWFSNLHRPIIENPQLREMVQTNVDLIIRKVAQLGHLNSTPTVTTQFILDCIGSAVSPRNLARTDVNFMPWF